MSKISFAKYEGIGNDFIVIDQNALPSDGLSVAQAVALCDRHRGVGADGVLVLGKNADVLTMHVINSDGSTPEMCGNGIRCAAFHFARQSSGSLHFEIDTDAGVHRCEVHNVVGNEAQVRVQMRAPEWTPSLVPVQASEPVINQAWRFGEDTLQVSVLSMGNPHVVTFDPVGEARLRLGPLVEKDERFPHGANVGFAQLKDSKIVLHVWERGAGWTEACGTGACAAAAAAVRMNLVASNSVAVELPGGLLTIDVGEPGKPLIMTGPAKHVFDGQIHLSLHS